MWYVENIGSVVLWPCSWLLRLNRSQLLLWTDSDMALFQIQSAELLHRSEPGNYARLVLKEEVMMG